MSWFSPYWFYPDTLLGFNWAYGYLLWLLGLVPGLFLLKWIFQSHKKSTLKMSTQMSKNIWANLRFLVPLFFMFGICSLILAIGRPQLPKSGSETYAEGIDLALAIDISDSMLDTDILPTRLEAAKDFGKSLVEGRSHDRIALVAFAGETITLSPLTTDHQSIIAYLEDLSTEDIRVSGTAIGMALASCVNKLRDVPGKSRVAIIISDGDNTAGIISPQTAVELAKTFGIRVYTIAIGTPYSVEVVDEATLRMMADESEGHFFRADDTNSLSNILEEINKLETTRAVFSSQPDMVDYYYSYLNWAFIFLLISFFLRFTFWGNLLED